ncbi:MAG: hypothetical protein J2P17_19580 [Mycobacterium sp.]|nr:hypothetical protein [Mycobacterium sp.]
MLTDSETKKVIISAGGPAIRPQAPVNVVDGDASAARLASSTTLSFPGRGSLPQSRPTIDPSTISDHDMVGLLVDAVKLCLMLAVIRLQQFEAA